MSIDFFNPVCQEIIFDNLFGLCDDQDGKRAYANIGDHGSWIATVRNNAGRRCVFTAIDHCVIGDSELNGHRRCDCMLTTKDHFFFVELKDAMKGWITDAVEQLESTIQIYLEHHPMPLQKYRKAYACNRSQSHFQEFDNEQNLRFFRTYNFRIDIQGEIIVI